MGAQDETKTMPDNARPSATVNITTPEQATDAAATKTDKTDKMGKADKADKIGRAGETANAGNLYRVDKLVGIDISFGKLVRASEVMDVELLDTTGEEIGNIHELLIDEKGQRVAYGIISVGDWVQNPNGDRFAVPWKMLRESTKESDAGFVLNAQKAQISNGPAYKANDRPDFNSDQWNMDVHRHYGQDWPDNTLGQL